MSKKSEEEGLPNLTCEDCYASVPFSHQGPCPNCGNPDLEPQVVIESVAAEQEGSEDPLRERSRERLQTARTERERPTIFLSYNRRDKPFVMKLARDLRRHGAKVWLDTTEVRVGESLIATIGQGIHSCDFLAVILSPSSVESRWVQTELRLAMTQELNFGRTKVLPLLYKDCEPPPYLADKVYADFRKPGHYRSSLKSILRALGLSAPAQVAGYESFPVGFMLYCLHYVVLAAIPLGFIAGKLMPGPGFDYIVGTVGWLLGVALLSYGVWKNEYGIMAIIILGPAFIPTFYVASADKFDFISVAALILGYLSGCIWLFAAFLLTLYAPDVSVRRGSLMYRMLMAVNREEE